MNRRTFTTRGLTIATGAALLAACAAAPDDELGTDRQEAMTVNAMTVNAMTVNGLSTNGWANYYMTRTRLHKEVWFHGTDAVSTYLRRQLTHPNSVELMTYLAGCVLDDGDSLHARDIHGATHEFHGALGLCPDWREKGGSASQACQELVSACLLAHNNAFDIPVRLSTRLTGLGATPRPPALELSGADVHVTETEPCTSPTSGESRRCGWNPGHVGTCTPGSTVQLRTGPGCSGEPMMRVCAGDATCDHWQALDDTAGGCPQALSFTCPTEDGFGARAGLFTVMTGPRDSWRTAAADPVVAPGSAPGTTLPAAEADVYWWREGAFYGNIFDHTRLNLWCMATGQGSALSCYEKGPDGWVPLSDPSDFEGTVYDGMYGCHSPEWDADLAGQKLRVCAGYSGGDQCAAHWVGNCWNSPDGYGDVAGSDGVPGPACAIEDAPAFAGDMDFDDCQSPDGRTWRRPVTVFLKDPCDTSNPQTCF